MATTRQPRRMAIEDRGTAITDRVEISWGYHGPALAAPATAVVTAACVCVDSPNIYVTKK